MSKDECIKRLKELKAEGDPENSHHEADHTLLAYIDDPEIEAAFEEIPKWYA